MLLGPRKQSSRSKSKAKKDEKENMYQKTQRLLNNEAEQTI